jgi:hypothetical protein
MLRPNETRVAGILCGMAMQATPREWLVTPPGVEARYARGYYQGLIYVMQSCCTGAGVPRGSAARRHDGESVSAGWPVTAMDADR